MNKLKIKSHSAAEEPQNSTIASISDYLKTVIDGDVTIENFDNTYIEYDD